MDLTLLSLRIKAFEFEFEFSLSRPLSLCLSSFPSVFPTIMFAACTFNERNKSLFRSLLCVWAD